GGRLGSGDEYLRPASDKKLEHAPLVPAIQLRGQVIQGHYRPLPKNGSMVSCLREQRGQGHQLGLPARKRIPPGQRAVADPPICPVRADGSKARLQVAVACQQQRVRQAALAFAPARQVLDRERPYSRHQIRSELRDPRRQGSQVFTAEIGEPFSEPGELKLPGSKLVG